MFSCVELKISTLSLLGTWYTSTPCMRIQKVCLSMLWTGNAILAGLPANVTSPLQMTHNAAARLVWLTKKNHYFCIKFKNFASRTVIKHLLN